MVANYIALAFKNVLSRKLRSSLTILGVVIGIAAIVALISVSQGLENAITGQFEKIGSNRVYVFAAGSGDPASRSGLTQRDSDMLNNMAEIKWVNRYFFDSGAITYGNEEKVFGLMYGVEDEEAEKRYADLDLRLQEGRFIQHGERDAVMFGTKAALDGFDKPVRVNSNIEFGGRKFKVVGIFEEIGNPQDDNAIYIPIDTFREIKNHPNSVTMIEIILKSGIDPSEAAAKIKHRLERIKDKDSFEVNTKDQILGQLGSILAIVQAVVVGIASISLLVGSVGIMNSMYTAVKERTSEIGIMKSLGARNANILSVFLYESAILGGIGGIIGVIIGVLIALGVQVGADAAGFSLLKVTIEPMLMMFGVMFAVGVGMIAGAIPARQAAKLQPVEALRK